MESKEEKKQNPVPKFKLWDKVTEFYKLNRRFPTVAEKRYTLFSTLAGTQGIAIFPTLLLLPVSLRADHYRPSVAGCLRIDMRVIFLSLFLFSTCFCGINSLHL